MTISSLMPPPKKRKSSPNRKAASAKPQTKTVRPTKKTGDDFFDMDSPAEKRRINTYGSSVDDFNF